MPSRFVGAPQVADLGTELAQLSGLLAGHTRPSPAVDLGLADPLAQRHGRPDAELGRHCLDGGTVRRVLRPHFGDHPHSPLTQLRG